MKKITSSRTFRKESGVRNTKKRILLKNMLKDISFIINTFLTCFRNQLIPVQEQPALALPITGIFDRIGIDLVFGLPETAEGFRGVMVITEYLTKLLCRTNNFKNWY